MIEYIVKSTISLTALYILYYFLLKNIKSFEFNRFFLLFAVMFSLTIPYIQISINSDLLNYQNIQNYSSAIYEINIQGENLSLHNDSVFDLSDLFLISYILVFSIFLSRFVINLWKIKKLINNSSKVLNTFPQIVLSNNVTLPYSFFQYIVLNKTEYEKGKIDYDLILHEQAHCSQNHSIDILFIEIVKIIFWFNPIIWVIKREIQLNHEYLADKKVLRTQNLKTYQNILLNLVFRNNSTYLASNFNYSLTKKRLIMMTEKKLVKNRLLRKLTVIPLIAFIMLLFSFNSNGEIEQKSEQLWYTNYLQKHGFSESFSKSGILTNYKNVYGKGHLKGTMAINYGDSLIMVVKSRAMIEIENGYSFYNGKIYNYSKNGDNGNGTFDYIEINAND